MPPNAWEQAALLPREKEQCPRVYHLGQANLYLGDFSEVSEEWPSPTVIVVDGPYGVASYPGDPISHEDLAEWYSPHVACWSKHALPETTLWFWNTEIGWASVHPVLARHGWEYRSCHVWDKGVGHIAGNANSKTLRRFPVVTEVCVQYVRNVTVNSNGQTMSLKQWVRHEWERSGLTLSEANLACGVKNAATRKYLTKCHLWYFPPPEAFELLAQYANRHGRPEGKPYYSLNGIRPATAEEWVKMRAKFHCGVGITNVWREPPVRGEERLKHVYKSVHMNQKPLRLLEQMILASSDQDDVVWEPFGGLCSTAIAALNTGRQCYSAEILEDYYRAALARLANHDTA
jgi:site-specific DNA-methyltransferase (adenine-specific)